MTKSPIALAVLSLGATAPVSAMMPPPPDPVINPVSAASSTFTLTWTNVCSTVNVTFPTCASARLQGWDNGWMSLDFWARAGINGTFETASVTAIGLGNTPAAGGDREDDWDAGFGGSQINWSPSNGGGGIPGPATADGFRTTGQGSAFCSGIDSNGATTPNCPGGITTIWGGGFNSGGGAIFYWFVGTEAIDALVDSEITLQMHVQAGPNGQSTGYNCLSDNFLNESCGGDNPDPPTETTVPEPATMTLLATGLAGMAAARRRKKGN